MNVFATTRAGKTANAARMLRAIAHPRPRKTRVPRQLPPTAIEREYGARVSAMIGESSRSAFAPVFDALPALIAAERASRVDAETNRPRILVDLAYRRMIETLDVERVFEVARRYGRDVLVHSRRQLARQVKAALGVEVSIAEPPARMLDRFIDENVTHIMAIPETLAVDVEKRITRMLSRTRLDATARLSVRQSLPALENARLLVNRPTGLNMQAFAAAVQRNVALSGSTRELAEELVERFDFHEEHAAFVARDQVGKLNGQSNAARQQALGLTRFTWRTSGDERVREEHAERDGEVYSYDDPPDGELPGEPINCRCSAEPIFDDILGELEE